MLTRLACAILMPLLLSGCGGADDAVTPEAFAASCLKYLRTSCERFTDCLAPQRMDASKSRDDYINACIAENTQRQGSCMERFAKSVCAAEEKAAADRCEQELHGAQCTAICTGTDFIQCSWPCVYFCKGPTGEPGPPRIPPR